MRNARISAMPHGSSKTSAHNSFLHLRALIFHRTRRETIVAPIFKNFIRRWLARAAAPALQGLQERLDVKITSALTERFEEKITYALNEISEMRQFQRMLLSESASFHQWIEQTRKSFDTQWDLLPEGAHLATDPEFLAHTIEYIEKYTKLPSSWFAGKSVLDAGCGNGRWAWVFSKLGAQVTAIDQSDHGLAGVQRLCREFTLFRAQRADLLQPLPLEQDFDFVWSFGVLHHTGDTKRAFDNVSRKVKPGGMICLMIYGEPTRAGEFAEINTYVRHRRKTSAMTFPEKIEYLRRIYPEEQVHGYFDAVSPAINDLYRFDEIRDWLIHAGFEGVARTFDSRNIIVTGTRKIGG